VSLRKIIGVILLLTLSNSAAAQLEIAWPTWKIEFLSDPILDESVGRRATLTGQSNFTGGGAWKFVMECDRRRNDYPFRAFLTLPTKSLFPDSGAIVFQMTFEGRVQLDGGASELVSLSSQPALPKTQRNPAAFYVYPTLSDSEWKTFKRLLSSNEFSLFPFFHGSTLSVLQDGAFRNVELGFPEELKITFEPGRAFNSAGELNLVNFIQEACL